MTWKSLLLSWYNLTNNKYKPWKMIKKQNTIMYNSIAEEARSLDTWGLFHVWAARHLDPVGEGHNRQRFIRQLPTKTHRAKFKVSRDSNVKYINTHYKAAQKKNSKYFVYILSI